MIGGSLKVEGFALRGSSPKGGRCKKNTATTSVKKALQLASAHFAEIGLDDPRLEAEIFLSVATKRSRPELYADFNYSLTSREKAAYENFVSLRLQGFPLQYITGTQTFRYLKLKIKPGVFIPRPETELLAEQAIETVRNLPQPVAAIDLGTGSGAIALSLAYEIPAVYVYAVDISPKALELASENAVSHNLRDRVSFIQSDLFKNLGKELLEKADLIVANPPYIPASALNDLPIEVQREPRIALDGGSDGLMFYRLIIEDAPRYLKTNGYLVFEVGMDQAQAVVEILKKHKIFGDIGTIRDYAGIERIVSGRMTND